MVLGLSLPAFVALHVAISLVGIVTGLVTLPALAAGKWLPRWNMVFLWTTLATSLTGFLFPFGGFTPALGTGIVATIVLIVAFAALYGFKRQGRAKTIYAVTATISLYLNLFVLVVQSFLKIAALHALAPTGAEPPFAAVQGAVLIASVALGYLVVRKERAIRV